MQNFIELKTGETKAVVGGVMVKGSSFVEQDPSSASPMKCFPQITGRGATTAMKA